MDIIRLVTGELMVAGHDHTPAEVRAALVDHLRGEGQDPFTADTAAANARLAPTFYSRSAGFMHDCAGHEPEAAVGGCADAEPVVVIATGG